MSLEVTPEAKQLLAEKGWDPAFGARPLKRTIQNLVQNPLSRKILEGSLADDDKILVTVQNGELAFAKAP